MYESIIAEYLDMSLPTYVPRDDCGIKLSAPARNNPIQVIVGVRRCGKTYYLYQLMDGLIKNGWKRDLLFHLSLDDDRFRPYPDHLLSDLLDEYFTMVPDAKKGCYLFLDEIQDIPDWESFIRRVSEQYPVSIVLTGSSSKLLSHDIPTLLRGRALSYEMWPLSFKEYMRFHKIDPPKHNGVFTKQDDLRLKDAFLRYLDTGGFPGVQNMDALDRTRMLQSYAEQIVAKDIVERFESATLRVAERFAMNALRSTGLSFSVNKELKRMRSTGLPGNSAKLYALLDDLEDANLVFHISDYERSVKENPKSAYKVYSVDPGLSLAVAPASHIDIGQRLESAIFIELKRRIAGMRDRAITSYSGTGCPEVDFLIGDVLMEKEYQLIQVAVETGSDEPSSKKFRSEVGNLTTAMRLTNLEEGWMITLAKNEEITTPSGHIHVVPAWQWMLSA